jgi:hypothetical protein
MEQTNETSIFTHDNIHSYTKGEEDEIKTFSKEGYFVGDRVSHIEIDSEEQKGLKNDHIVQLFILHTIMRTQ